ncbi:hypothetical protein ACET3Z_026140 [Daucus carota]
MSFEIEEPSLQDSTSESCDVTRNEFEDTTQQRNCCSGSSPLLGFRRGDYSSSPPPRGDSSNSSRGIYGKWGSLSSGQKSGRPQGNPLRRSWQSSDHDGLLGSGSQITTHFFFISQEKQKLYVDKEKDAFFKGDPALLKQTIEGRALEQGRELDIPGSRPPSTIDSVPNPFPLHTSAPRPLVPPGFASTILEKNSVQKVNGSMLEKMASLIGKQELEKELALDCAFSPSAALSSYTGGCKDELFSLYSDRIFFSKSLGMLLDFLKYAILGMRLTSLQRQRGPLSNSGKNITLEALFGTVFMKELQSVEALVSVHRTVAGSARANYIAPHGLAYHGGHDGSHPAMGDENKSNQLNFENGFLASNSEQQTIGVKHGAHRLVQNQLPEEENSLLIGDPLKPTKSSHIPAGNLKNEEISSNTSFDIAEKLASLNAGYIDERSLRAEEGIHFKD